MLRNKVCRISRCPTCRNVETKRFSKGRYRTEFSEEVVMLDNEESLTVIKVCSRLFLLKSDGGMVVGSNTNHKRQQHEIFYLLFLVFVTNGINYNKFNCFFYDCCNITSIS